ncbi:histidine phosphatase family protein [Thalassotalea sp. PLHSN55]|uniref:histidine phosphatase family protein n=1 Tax=Thalassotalea sp. PLHSN55 TaxID=3435888 RepID=UPI003F87E83F
MRHNCYLHLARHGQTQWNVEAKLQGQRDSNLTVKGRQQVRALALNLDKQGCQLNRPITALYCSSLGRANKTAALCAQILKIKAHVLPHLQERHLGLWQGQAIKKLARQNRFQRIYHQQSSVTNLCAKPPCGESLKNALQRFHQALLTIGQQEQSGDILIISHGDIIKHYLAVFHHDARFSDKLTTKENIIKNGEQITLQYNAINHSISHLKSSQ